LIEGQLSGTYTSKFPTWNVHGAADHGVSEAIYLHDPDDNGIEIYTDRQRERWPHDANGNLLMYTRLLDLNGLLAELK
jgi:catechol 2,3-dioxygenase